MIKITKNRIRLDQHLVDLGLVESKKKAQALIYAGKVIVEDQRVDRPATMVNTTCKVRIKSKPYVGRGAEKLLPALSHFNLAKVIKGGCVLDVGASTGGFTQACLEFGAKNVIAVDVGTNQLAWSLRTDPRVLSLEKTDIRNYIPECDFSLVVCDVSFISIKIVADFIIERNKSLDTHFLFLVKPQFELASKLIPKGGVISSESKRSEVVAQVSQLLTLKGLKVSPPFNSPVLGRQGNQETFLHATW